nr:hypothetical protein [Planctomycetota bacterium]
MSKKTKQVPAEELDTAIETIAKLTLERDGDLSKYQRAAADCPNRRRPAAQDIRGP